MQNISDPKNPFILLKQENIYDNLAVEGYQPDLQGWIHPEFDTIIKPWIDAFSQNSLIIEVGSWKGLSTNKMAEAMKRSQKNGHIIAIDTWLGAPEFWIDTTSDQDHDLQKINGYPSVYYTFIKNIKSLGNQEIIVPFPISSAQGYEVLKHYHVQADLIYIDAAHEEDAVFEDLEKYFSLLKPGSIMFGDDYVESYWPGVIAAVNRFAKKHTLKVEIIPSQIEYNVIWYIRK